MLLAEVRTYDSGRNVAIAYSVADVGLFATVTWSLADSGDGVGERKGHEG
jgi:hypothetical protein